MPVKDSYKDRVFTTAVAGYDGLPRIMDMGQCDDAYAAIKAAKAPAEAFKCGVHDLPLTLILSWYEQKVAAILLTLLHLGLKNTRRGLS
jgi:hydroxylamine reductase